MIIKSHIRSGYRDAAAYLKEQGENELTRLVEISDPDAEDLDRAFQNMWVIASHSRAKKPLHHVSINPRRDERLTDAQVLKTVERCEEKYEYKPGEHQRVIVEHIKDGRQHFHVMWNRVNLKTGKAVWPGLHWNKSKEAAREMEAELGLKRWQPKSKSKSVSLKPSSVSLKPLPYAGMLSDAPETEPKRTRSGKGDKSGSGSSGGATSAFKSAKKIQSRKKKPGRVKPGKDSNGPGNGPERRRGKMWVPVERRRNP